MHNDRIAFLVATRSTTGPQITGLDHMAVPEQSADDTQRLLDGTFAAPVAARLWSQVGGNPLALLEIGRQLTPAQRRGAAPLPHPLPVGGRVDAAYRAALTELSPDAWRTAVLAAAAVTDHTDHAVTALAQDDHGVRALDELQRQQILVRDGTVLRFRHPLLRAAVWRRATPTEWRAAHRTLAGLVGDADIQTWHRAQAAEGTDDTLADDLVTPAHRPGHARASRPHPRHGSTPRR